MPLVRLETDRKMDEGVMEGITAGLTAIVSEATGKPSRYVMTTVCNATTRMSDESGGSALVQVMSIGGLGPSVNGGIAASITGLLNEELGISPDRIYITFTDVPGENWAWQGRTFR